MTWAHMFEIVEQGWKQRMEAVWRRETERMNEEKV